VDVPPAPGADRYVALDFVNSVVTVAGGHALDLLGTPEAANRWLTERDLAPAEAGIQEPCAAQLRALREHVRALITAVIAGHPGPASAIDAINDAMTRVPTAAPLRWDSERRLHRQVSHPTTQIVDHALAVLAADAADLLTSGDAQLLTACGSPPCRRYLLRTHRRRHWCSVRCGDRARAARAYARRATGPAAALPSATC
jgi:predicted RNA-binding Zn ribbon-like protein